MLKRARSAGPASLPPTWLFTVGVATFPAANTKAKTLSRIRNLKLAIRGAFMRYAERSAADIEYARNRAVFQHRW